MDMSQIIEAVRSFDGALVVAPDAGSAFPELAWGDAFFFYAPDGRMPERTQPYATIITKDYPDDAGSGLDAPGRFRVNVHLARDRAAQLTTAADRVSEADVVLRHPLYGDAGWVCVVNPLSRTADLVLELLREAHDAARARATRRGR